MRLLGDVLDDSQDSEDDYIPELDKQTESVS